MTNGEPTFVIDVDVTNPGQFFACCGILELSHRLWSPEHVTASFSTGSREFSVFVHGNAAGQSVTDLWKKVANCVLTTLTEEQRSERETLEQRKRDLRPTDETLTEEDEKRRVELGTLAREGPVRIGAPFHLTLNWWEVDAAPKTWAGLQEIHKIARAAQQAISEHLGNSHHEFSLSTLRVVLRKTPEYYKKEADAKDKVEPFFFDARRFCDALSTGYSLDEQEFETVAFPIVELLALVGLQRFRPSVNEDGTFTYSVWHHPLAVDVAASATSTNGVFPGTEPYRFAFAYRDGQHRYKSFQFSHICKSEAP